MTALARIAPVAATVTLLVVLVAACAGGGSSDGVVADGADVVAARVDGREIRQDDVDQVLAEQRLTGDAGDSEAALESAIDRELVRAEAERLGLAAAEAEVESRLAAVSEQFGGDEALAAALRQAAMSEEQLRESLTIGVLREAVQDARFPGVSAGREAARDFYERRRADLFTRAGAVKLGAIVVRNDGIAGNAIRRLRRGRPFREVARQFSIDPEIKAAQGMLGWTDPRSLPGPLGAAVTRLPVGRLSAPVAGPGGTWVFKVFARRPEEVTPFARVRKDIESALTARRRSAALDEWLAAARKDARIERL